MGITCAGADFRDRQCINIPGVGTQCAWFQCNATVPVGISEACCTSCKADNTDECNFDDGNACLAAVKSDCTPEIPEIPTPAPTPAPPPTLAPTPMPTPPP